MNQHTHHTATPGSEARAAYAPACGKRRYLGGCRFGVGCIGLDCPFGCPPGVGCLLLCSRIKSAAEPIVRSGGTLVRTRIKGISQIYASVLIAALFAMLLHFIHKVGTHLCLVRQFAYIIRLVDYCFLTCLII